MPSEPHPSRRDSSRASQICEGAVGGDPDPAALEVLGPLDFRIARHRQAHAQGLVGDDADGLGRNALGEEAHRGARSQAEIDRLRDERLLHFRVAREDEDFDGEAMLGPDLLFDADVDRRKGQRLTDRLRDADLVLGGGAQRPDAGCRQHQDERGQSSDATHVSVPLNGVSSPQVDYVGRVFPSS